MDYYDIVLNTCKIEDGLESRLGFKKMFMTGRDVGLFEVDSPKVKNAAGGIIIGANKGKLFACARGEVKAVVISDSRIDKKLIEWMAGNGIVLCMPMSAITASFGIDRAKIIYLMEKLFSYAKKSGVHVSFVTLAGSNLYLSSIEQLVELAKLVGADEQYARYSIGSINRTLIR